MRPGDLTLADHVARALWPGAGGSEAGAFFLIDAARDPAIYPALRALAATEPVIPLYDGASAVELAGVAPYLLQLGQGGDGFTWLFDDAERAGWGVFVRTAARAGALRQHFRRLTRARLEDGRVVLFRFYDPRVLSVFAPSCDPGQASALFGPIQAYLAIAAPGRMETFTAGAAGVRREALVLPGAPAGAGPS